jgi:ABC-2 type transport system permease protein
MFKNNAFELVSERGWRRGLSSMLRSEFAHWWQTRLWWIQCLIWGGIVGFMLGGILFTTSNPTPSSDTAILYSIFAGLFPAVGVTIIMQGVVVGEKKDGTAAWVLSKPVTRQAFIMSKVITNSVGVLATMVILPGILAYSLNAIASKTPWSLIEFLAALAGIFLCNFFFLSLTLMLGTIFSDRGPVIGISLGLLFLQQYLVGLIPFLRYVLPWNLVIPIGKQVDAVVPCLLIGTPYYSFLPVLAVALESILFIIVALYRFNREEF